MIVFISIAFVNLAQFKAQLNAVRGHLRTTVHRELYRPIKDLLEATCKCRENTLWGYERALTNTELWPLEDIGRYTTMQPH